jgi:hypothetical protein
MIKKNNLERVYHLADELNWESIQTHGLRSAARLLEENKLNEWIRRQRTENMQLPNGVIIRDQKPMPPEALKRCLASGVTPADWYALLNRHVFFWIDLDRLERQRKACTTPQYIMTIDAKKMLHYYASSAAVTPSNTGNARRAAAHRGLATFVPYHAWVNSGWAHEAAGLGSKRRAPSHQPVELAIADTVPDILEFVVDVRRLEL